MKHETAMLNEITELIYIWVFGMTRSVMLIECKRHTPAGWANLYDDEDENIRDQLSISALNCLTGAEKAAATYLETHGIIDVAAAGGLYSVIKPYYIDGIVIWNDDAIDREDES